MSSNVACVFSTNKGNITTKSSAGGIVGYSNTSKTPNVQNCLNIGNILGPECNSIGGIIGKAYCPISANNNTNIGNVVGKEQVGGIIGYLSTTSTTYCNINSNVNKGNIEANNYYSGILGYGYGANISLNNCTNSGKITNLTKSQHSAAIGGIIGEATNSTLQCNQNTNEGKIMIEAPGHSIGGIIGEATNLKSGSSVNSNINKESAIISINANSSSNSNSFMIGGCIGKIENSNGLNVNKNFASINVSVKGENSPVAYSIGGIVGEAEQPGQITSSQNTGDITITADDRSYDVGGIVGKGNKLSVLASNENISDINFESGKINNVGGIIGNSSMSSSTSTVTQLKSNGIIKFTTSVTSTSNQASEVGGIFGYMQSSNALSKCEHIGKIDLPSGVNIGGIIGNGNNNIESSCHVGDIIVGGNSSNNVGGIFGYISSAPTIKTSYVKGNITCNGSYTGTMVGYGSSPAITNAYYCCKINNNDTDKIIGNLSLDVSSYKLSEADSQKQESYVGFDFSNTWKWDETRKIPVLK